MPGPRPIFVNMKRGDDEDYLLGMKEVQSKIPQFVNNHGAILCGEDISVDKVAKATSILPKHAIQFSMPMSI